MTKLAVYPLVLLACVGLLSPATARSRGAVARSSFDPEIAAMLRQIDPARIEQTIRKLVSFGTRNTLSVQGDPNRGIGAARDWLTQAFAQLKPASGGRLTVEQQSFVQPVA